MTFDRHALLRAAVELLPGPTARLDAEVLLAHVLGCERLDLLADRGPIDGRAVARFQALIARRRQGEPVAHLTGRREFWSLDLAVTPDVLVPRPESETLIEAAVAFFTAKGRAPASILDLGTGSGALLLAALSVWPDAWGVGLDRSVAALRVASGNARTLGFGARVSFLASDWGDALEGRFDLVLANPPYVPTEADLPREVRLYEPAMALFAGPDGLAAYRRILPQLPRLLAPAGVAVLELGAGQQGVVGALASAMGFRPRFLADLAGIARAVLLTRSPAGLGKPDLAD